jgi:hypothetical protein
MKPFFSFFLRLFICFVAAKFLLGALALETRTYLVGLTALFTANVYLLDYLVFRDRQAARLENWPGPEDKPAAEAEKPT